MKRIILLASLALSINAFTQIPSYVPTNGLVGWWPFNGNANDESGNGKNGIVKGATLTKDRFGNINAAYKFNGESSVTLSNFNSIIGNSAFSVSFWVKPIGTGWMVAFGTSSNGNGFNCGNKSQIILTLRYGSMIIVPINQLAFPKTNIPT